MFLTGLEESLAEHSKFNQSEFNENVFEMVEKPFTTTYKKFRITTQGNSIIN